MTFLYLSLYFLKFRSKNVFVRYMCNTRIWRAGGKTLSRVFSVWTGGLRVAFAFPTLVTMEGEGVSCCRLSQGHRAPPGVD